VIKMEIKFLVRKGHFNLLNPNEITTNVHIKIGDAHINVDFDENDYDYWAGLFESNDIDEIIDSINEACDHVISHIYNSNRENAMKIKDIITTEAFRKSLKEYLISRIDKKIGNLEKSLNYLLKEKEQLKDDCYWR